MEDGIGSCRAWPFFLLTERDLRLVRSDGCSRLREKSILDVSRWVLYKICRMKLGLCWDGTLKLWGSVSRTTGTPSKLIGYDRDMTASHNIRVDYHTQRMIHLRVSKNYCGIEFQKRRHAMLVFGSS